MQGSFWKTVALVAVIGVGSLAILEVQDRLKNSPSALEASAESEDLDLSDQLKLVTETAVNAQLTESDFDKMMKEDFLSNDQATVASRPSEGAAGFDLSEPNDGTRQAFASGSDNAAAQFSLADIGSQGPDGQQAGTVAGDWESAESSGNSGVQLASSSSVDTNIDPNFLSESPNPFATADSGNQPGTNASKIQPTGFVANEQPSFDPSSDSPFAAFDPSAADSADPFSDAITDSAAAARNLQAEQSLGSQPASPMQFYNGANRNESGDTESKTVNATAAAFDQEFPSNTFDGSADVGNEFQQFPADDANLNPSSEPATPFPGFDFGPEPSSGSTQPERIPGLDLNSADETSPFFEEFPAADALGSNELVPMPRPRPDESIDFDSDESLRGSFNDSLSDADSLPFVEDSGSSVPVLNPVPDNRRDMDLAIPRTNRDRQPEPGRSNFDGGNFNSEPSSPRFDRDRNMDLNPITDRNPELNWDSDFSDAPATNPSRPEPLAPRIPERRTPELNPLQNNPFGPSNRRSDDLGSSMDNADRTMGSDRRNVPQDREINPGFNSEPRRIPTMEDRRDDLRRPMNNDIRIDAPSRVNPGFGSDLSDNQRTNSGRRSEDSYLNGDSRPVRELGDTDRSRDFSSQPSSRNPGYGENSNYGSRPIRSDREFGGSSSNRRQENLRNVDQGMSANIRQVASVMRPKLILQKEAPENATVGTPLQYSITVRNDGDAYAYDVVVEDEVTSTSRIDAAKPQASRSNDGERLVWEFDSIAPGEEEQIQVQVTPTGEGVLDGIATVKFKSRVKATTMITAPRLELKMEGPAKVRLGDKVQYRYVITNEGSGEARSVFVRTVLPQNGGLRHPQGQDLEYEIPLMEPGEQREILLSVVAGEPGSQQAQAIVTSRNGSKDQATWSTDVVGAQLQMLRRGPKRRFVSKTARYENIVTNETDFDAVNARVVERIPPGMEFKAAGQNGRFDPVEKTVTWEIRRLAAKATTTLQLELEPRVAGQQDSRVTIFENIGAQSDDYVSTTVVEDLHNVSATISQLDGPVALGEVFGFTIAVDNRGTADATDIQLSVEVPAEIEVFGAGTKEFPAGLKRGTNTVVYQMVVRIKPDQQQDFELKLRGIRPGRNKIVKASVKYTQMSEPLEISESVTIYDDRN